MYVFYYVTHILLWFFSDILCVVDEWRDIRMQQDMEYEESLQKYIAKVKYNKWVMWYVYIKHFVLLRRLQRRESWMVRSEY